MADSKSKSGASKKGIETEEHEIPSILPVVPARDLVGFPSVLMSLHIGRPKSVRAIEGAEESGKFILLLAQNAMDVEDPGPEDFFQMGVVAEVVRSLKLPEGRFKVLLQGLVRAKVKKFIVSGKFVSAEIEPIFPPDTIEISAEDEVIMNRIRENLQVLVEYEHIAEEMLIVTEEIDEPGQLADVILAHYQLEVAQAQEALNELDPIARLKMTDKVITDDMNQFLVVERIRSKARDELTRDQKDYYLRQQIKQIRRELGEEEALPEDLDDLRQALEDAGLPNHAKKEARRQLQRLERIPQEASEYSLLRTYLEWIADLPWSNKTRERHSLKTARAVLDKEHFGLEKVKERILEYLSVRKLKKNPKGPILCFVGPPGVGKTSLGKSIANALNRNFYRMSLGGMRDEAEIRGHRRTYVGALPGRILQGMKHAGAKNALIVLDELDKVGADFRGDPSAALLEVLDPQQNKEFTDHYLNMAYDLSEVIFIATANTIDTIPDALLDRLEVIRISGYTTEEKVVIAQKYLIPRQLDENGLKKLDLKWDKNAIFFLVKHYTREAGVRNLEREIGALCRKVAREYAENEKYPKKITEKFVRDSLGPTRFEAEFDERIDSIGLVRGLAWTRVGGEIMHVEASVATGSGNLALTGQLGDVMQESARAALFFARSNAESLGLDPDFYKKLDVHIHVPHGATPKDGPSAGSAIVCALVSVLSGRRVSRDLAMTGEITLRGNILPIGGLKEKALAALHHGIQRVVIPYENIKDLEEIPKEQREQIKFIPVKHVREVLEIALLGKSKVKVKFKASAKKSGRQKGSKIIN